MGLRAIKVIRGEGATGTAGGTPQPPRQYLCDQLKNKLIKAYCSGENFGPFENAGRQLVDLVPALHKDPDWGRQNDGITMVVLR